MPADVITVIKIGWVTITVLMFIFWVIQFVTRNAGILDLGWAMGLGILAGVYAVTLPGYPPRKVLLFTLVCFWMVRIASLIMQRLIHDPQEDRRYRQARQNGGSYFQIKLLTLFLSEAFLAVILSVPFLVICLNHASSMAFLEYAGGVLWAVGFSGEAAADWQLKSFKVNLANQGKICQEGLWYYSRHPNYFFEWLMWIAYAVIALASPWGWAGIISPVIMYFFLTKVTGIPMIEEYALKTKGEAFREYTRTTSPFILLPKRR